ncbi:MAG: glycoside hydrolase family 35 protein [Candidatus Acidiferrales bacterium]
MPSRKAPALLATAATAVLVAAVAFPHHSRAQQAPPEQSETEKFSPITISGTQFMRDGKPYEVLSGEIHYARVPRDYWRDRLRKIRAMGLNTIQVYAFWNAHEPRPGVFDFTGNLDVAEFLRTAREENLNVLMRLGPYACGEWDAGGFPAWLFEDGKIKVRSTDPQFLAAAGEYLDHIGAQIAPYLGSKGGPIIGLQIENEYGSYGPRAAHGMGPDPAATRREAHEYMEAIRKLFVHAGLANEMFYTADGTDLEQMEMGELDGVLAAANFGPGEAKGSIARIKARRPNQPVMIGEYWDGWFDSWGDDHQTTDTAKQLDDVKWFLSNNYSFNLYMVHGGTTRGFWNGANQDDGPDSHYAPETSSYDYDAPIDEAGRPTKKYFAFRDAIAAHTGVQPPDVPQNLPIVAVPDFALAENAPLSKNLPTPASVKTPQSMESFGQGYGYILYRTVVRSGVARNSTLAPPSESEMDAGNSSARGNAGAPPSPIGSGDKPQSADGGDLPSSASGDGVHIGADGSITPQKKGLWGRDELAIKELRDFAAIYINGKLVGTLDRRLNQDTLTFDLNESPATLDILVENTGRVNFGRHLPDGRGGITDAVILNGAPLLNWKSYSLPMMSPTDISGKSAKAGNVPSPDPIVGWSKHKPEGPSFYRGHFTMDSPADTFLDVSGVQKGFVWVNGHNLGRAWNVGPTRTLYVPAPWLVKGDNEVIAFDIFPDSASQDPSASAQSKSRPIATKMLRGVTDPIYIKHAAMWDDRGIWCEQNCGGPPITPPQQLVDAK